MAIFLGISFFHYHRRFRRKRNLAMEYVIRSLDVKRPRIGSPGCVMSFQELIASNSGDIYTMQNGDVVRDRPVSVRLPKGTTQMQCTYQNQVFEGDTPEEECSNLSVINVDFHKEFEEQDFPKGSSELGEDVDVQLHLSQLCHECATKVLSFSNQTGRISSEYKGQGESNKSRRKVYDSGEDYSIMDAFHSRPQPRTRRARPPDTSRNMFRMKGW